MHHLPKQLDDLVQCIVEVVHPLRIILFGSAARGEMGLNSDVDVLVVMPEGTHRRHTAMHLYKHLTGFPLLSTFSWQHPGIWKNTKTPSGLSTGTSCMRGKKYMLFDAGLNISEL